MKEKKRIIVVGSCNTDMVIRVDHLPLPGETIIGHDFITNQGGKGANQAVAVKRLGGDTAFIARLGNDDFGAKSLRQTHRGCIYRRGSHPRRRQWRELYHRCERGKCNVVAS